MLVHPQFDPIAVHFKLGPIQGIHWYGLMYLVGFTLFLLLGRHRLRTLNRPGWDNRMLDDLLFYGVIAVIVGARLGEVLFYNPGLYWAHPEKIFAVWEGGMSFHGGFIGVLLTMAWFAHKRHFPWLQLTDFIAPLVPTGLAAGRLGNFINGELWGRPTDLPWGMWFPQADPQPLARHPSQLYELALEGIVLFVILWFYSKKPRPMGAVSGLFLVGYGSFRFLCEFARNPDTGIFAQTALGVSMGQWLSLPMLLAGIGLMVWAYKRKGAGGTAQS